jgi:hypothetical protein
MIRGPNDASEIAGARSAMSLRAWIWACVLLVVVTWTPVLAVHVRNMSVADSATGALLVVFPPTTSTLDLLRGIAAADGALVEPVRWMPRTWIVQSKDAGFAGRLRERGAWGVFSPELLSINRVLSCSGMLKRAP